MAVEEIIEKIYKIHKESHLYDGSFEDTIYKLTNAYDAFFIDIVKNEKIRAQNKYLPSDNKHYDNLDLYRHGYRACIKFACEDCQKGDLSNKITQDDITKYQKEIDETVQFNFIRNTIDQSKVGSFDIKEDGNKLTFIRKTGFRDVMYDIYSRNIADMVPGGKNQIDDGNVFNLNLYIADLIRNKLDFDSKKLFKPKKAQLIEITYDLGNHFLKDLDAKEVMPYKLSGYTLEQYFFVYCYLATIAIYKIAYIYSLKNINDPLHLTPSVVYPKERLVTDVAETFDQDEGAIRAVVNDMIYDYEFHKDKVTIFQPLFEIGDQIIFSSYLLLHAYVVDKIMRFYDMKRLCQPTLTKYHKYLSDQMNNRMADWIDETYPFLKTYINCKLIDKGSTQAEVDLIIFDENTKKAALIELKNYSPVDNELDAKKKESHINSAIKSRLEKDKRVLDNLEKFFKQNEIPNDYLNYNFSSLLITNSYSGGCGVIDTISVVDEPLFYYLLGGNLGNLELTIDMIDKKDIYHFLDKNVLDGKYNATYSYKGINVEVINK